MSPLIYLLMRAAGAGWQTVIDIVIQQRMLELSLRSLGLAAAVAVTCVVVGIPVAWVITRTDVPGGRWWLVVAALPLAIPSYVTAYTWIATWPSLQGGVAAWLLLTFSCLPYVVLPVAAVLSRVDPAFDDVARTQGYGPVRAFHKAVAPLLLPAAAAGALLAALYVLSDFGAVSLLRFDSFTRVIYSSYRASFDRTSAAVLALVLVFLASLFVLLERRIRGRQHRWRTSSGVARHPARVPLGALRLPALVGLAVLYGTAVAFPMGVLVRLTVAGGADWHSGEWLAATGNTVKAAGIGACFALILALPIGILAARYSDRWSRVVESTAFLGHALPGVVVGLALVFLGLALVPGLYQTLAMLGFAYAVLFLSNAIGAVRAATDQVPPVVEDVSRSLGSNGPRTWFRVTLPLTLPGITAGTLLVLLTAMKELPATLMLRPTGMDTLATELWTRTSVSDYSAAAPYAATLVVVAGIPAMLLARQITRQQR